MDFSQGRNIKSLSDSEYYIWSKISQELDPAKWAYLCRKIGEMIVADHTPSVSAVRPYI